MRLLVIVAIGCLLTACSSGDAPASAPTDSPTPTLSSSPSDTAPEEPSSTPTQQGSAPCDAATTSGVEDTIRSQLAEFADADFAGARAYASDGFQSSVDEEQFQEIIEAQYGFLLEEADVEFLECEQIEDLAQVFVRFDASIDLRYRLVRQPEGWRIDGATIVEMTPGVEV